MRIDIISAVPEILASPLKTSIIKRSLAKKLVEIRIHNLHDYSSNKYKSVDDYQYGGGSGMVLQIEPIFNCINRLKNELAIADTAKIAYVNALKRELESSENTKPTSSKSKPKK